MCTFRYLHFYDTQQASPCSRQVLRKIFGTSRRNNRRMQDTTQWWARWLPDVRVIKLWWMRLAGFVACTRETSKCKSVWGKPSKKPLGTPSIDGSTILKWFLNRMGVNWIHLAGWVVGCCEHDEEPLGSMKCREFLDWVRNSYLKKGWTPYSQLHGWLVCWLAVWLWSFLKFWKLWDTLGRVQQSRPITRTVL